MPRDKSSRNLERRLSGSGTPLFVLDQDRKLVAFNAGCEALTGWKADEVLGEVCLYGSVPDANSAHALAASLCPPVEVFQGTPLLVPARIARRTGDAVARQIQFLPVQGSDPAAGSILGVILPPGPPAALVSSDLPARLHADLSALRSRLRQRFGPQALIARSPVMSRVLVQVELAQYSPAFVLLQGEPGTGREHLARVVHFGGAAKAHWFIPLDCRRMSAEEIARVIHRLLELHSPLRAGPEPQPGTVFLGDVDLLSRDLQGLLAEAFTPLLRPRLRLMASTAACLPSLVEREEFRGDFYRLISPLTMEIPPLRMRGEDRRLLAIGFLEELNRQGSRQVNGFADDVWPLIERYRWPGNLDELADVVREAWQVASESLVRAADLPFRFRDGLNAQDSPPAVRSPAWNLDAALERVETQMIRLALERARNNKSEAADALGINRARLLRRIQQLGLNAGEARSSEDFAPPEPGNPD